MLVAVALGGCVGETESPGTPITSGPAAVEPPPPPPPEVPAPSASPHCRWQGYGIGPSGQTQCNTVHLNAHSARECFEIGGQVAGGRTVSGRCQDQAEEVQMSCCFAGPFPPATVTAGPAAGALDEHVSATAPGTTRADLAARAEQVCVARGVHLGDWSVLYGPDGVSADVLRFYCH